MRDEFHAALDALLEMSEVSDEMLRDALAALAAHDAQAAANVIRRDAIVDRLYQDNQAGTLRALALQAPVAGDLRRVAAMRTSTSISNAWATTPRAWPAWSHGPQTCGTTATAKLAQQLLEMGEHARRVSREGIRSFVQGDEALA